MKRFIFFFFATLLFVPFTSVWAQTPAVNPYAVYYLTDENGDEESDTLRADGQPLSAPVHIEFVANPTIPEGYKSQAWYEWTLWKANDPENILLRRNDETFEYDFVESGGYVVKLRAIFYGEEGVEDYEFPNEEEGEEPKYITFTISESKLEFPNAISPGCSPGSNDELRPKDGFKGIVSFHAVVFNRWGKKIYSWDDVHGSWDGTYNGKVVKDGVYFLNVSAKGSDGIDYKIKKAINVITGYSTENENGTEGGEE